MRGKTHFQVIEILGLSLEEKPQLEILLYHNIAKEPLHYLFYA